MRPPLSAELNFGLRFYLGLGASAQRRRFPECRLRAARGYRPELIRELLQVYRQQSPEGTLERVNFRSGSITLPDSSARFFIKEFPWHHRAHDVERALRLSRADRAWRAAHLLPRMNILTPKAVGTAQVRGENGKVIEYLVTEWLEGSRPFPEALKAAGEDRERRAVLLQEFAAQMRLWHRRAVYSRDLVRNVLVRENSYWLTDLDGVHPIRRVNAPRILFHLRQLAYWSQPWHPEEVELILQTYLGSIEGKWAESVREALCVASTRRPQV